MMARLLHKLHSAWQVLRSARFGAGMVVGGLCMWLVAAQTVRAHDFRVGSIVIDHPLRHARH